MRGRLEIWGYAVGLVSKTGMITDVCVIYDMYIYNIHIYIFIFIRYVQHDHIYIYLLNTIVYHNKCSDT